MPKGSVHVALLRAVNVGGNNKLPMKELVAMFADAGAADVRTYIASGNVIFQASAASVPRITKAVTRAIEERFGFDAPMVTRSAQELANVVRDNPFVKAKADPATLHVVFLANAPDPKELATLETKRVPPEEIVLKGRELFLRMPNGVGRSKLALALGKALTTTSTMRNWRTVLKLEELTP